MLIRFGVDSAECGGAGVTLSRSSVKTDPPILTCNFVRGDVATESVNLPICVEWRDVPRGRLGLRMLFRMMGADYGMRLEVAKEALALGSFFAVWV